MSVQPSEAEWEARKPRIGELCSKLNVPMRGSIGEELINTMSAEGFFAQEHDYLTHFKKWGWSKYDKSKDWKQVALVLADRTRRQKRSEIFRWGKLITNEDARKAMDRQRSRPSTIELHQVLPPLPEGFTVRTPIEFDRTAALSRDLPFSEFESSIMKQRSLSTNRMAYIDPRLLHTTESAAAVGPARESFGRYSISDEGTFGIRDGAQNTHHRHILSASTLASLNDLVPNFSSDYFLREPAAADPDYSNSVASIPPLYRAVLYSVANGFAGLQESNVKEAIRFLQHETSHQLYQFIRDTPGFCSRAIAQNLFKGSIEVGDARVVSWLLQERAVKIDPNEQICSAGGNRYTPIERAASLRHKGVIEVLLHHGADVHKTYNHWHPQGALDHAIGLRRNIEKYTRVDPDIFKVLLEAGGDVDHDSIAYLINRHDDENSFKFLHEDVCIQIIKIMVEGGADINYNVENPGPAGKYPRRIIDMAADRGSLEMVETLRGHGAVLTGDTLPCAVASGNVKLVTFLMSIGARLDEIGSLNLTPLAAAVRHRDPNMVEILRSNGALKHIGNETHFSSLLEAASEAGDMQWIEFLVQLGGEVKPQDLGRALVIATRDGHDETAENLIEAGADLEICSSGGGSPLWEALKRRNERIVLLLLDSGANLDHEYGEPAAVLAAEWGNRTVLKECINAGANVSAVSGFHSSTAALAIAVSNRDKQMVEILLQAGADINNPKSRMHGPTALSAAAQNEDMEMIEYLLQRGADPNDSEALSKAASGDQKISRRLLDGFRARYPAKLRPRGYGSATLAQAVSEGNEALIELLLSYGTDPNHMVWERARALSPFGTAIVTAQANRLKIVETFLAAECDPNQVVSQTLAFDKTATPRVTAFMAAITTRDPQLINLLVKKRATVNLPAKGRIKRTPLQMAVEVGDHNICELLLNLGAKVNSSAASRGGRTALQLAAIGGKESIACLLLNHGAEVDAPAAKVDGYTALEGAATHGRLNMVKLLLNAGACSGGKDKGQLRRAATLAKDVGNFVIVDLLEASMRQGKRFVEEEDAEDVGMALDDDAFLNYPD